MKKGLFLIVLMVISVMTFAQTQNAPEWTNRKEEGQIEHTQHDPGHFSIALALAEYVADL